MSLESIKEILAPSGYSFSLKNGDMLIVGKSMEPRRGYSDVFKLDYYCSITHEKDDAYTIYYGKYNVQDDVDLPTESEVINWIKQHFPI